MNNIILKNLTVKLLSAIYQLIEFVNKYSNN